MTRRQIAKLATLISKLEVLQLDVARRNDARVPVELARLASAKAELLALLRHQDWT
jgi:hypothetical protein